MSSPPEKPKSTRREFLAGVAGAIVGLAVGAAAGSAAFPRKITETVTQTATQTIERTATATVTQTVTQKVEVKPWLPEKWDYETDVVVIGAGGAGLSAAIAAHDAKAEVIILEKAPSSYFSSTALSVGYFAAAGTRFQKSQGIQDSPDLFYEDVMKEGEYTNNPELLRTFVDNAAETLDWLEENGLKITTLGYYAGFRVNRMHLAEGGGKAYIDVLDKLRKQRNIPVLYETRATKLLTDPTTSRVIGVEAETKGKKIAVKARRAVIVTTGGFGSNPEIIDKYMLDFRGGLCGSSPEATGDGLNMCIKVGSDVTHLNYGAWYCTGVTLPGMGRRGIFTRVHYLAWYSGAIYVNKLGKRFIKEETAPTAVSYELMKQPGNTMFVIADQTMWVEWLSRPETQVTGWSNEQILKEGVKIGIAKSANTIRDLAIQIGVDPDVLEKTVANYNSYVEAGVDPEFGRDKEHLRRKIETPPFYAIETRPILMVCVGGVRVNASCQVLDPYGNPIPGLYAAGEVIGGLHGKKYIGGDALGSAITLGRVAGKKAAAEMPWE
jgi:fumarate reductase flavoprotein subunit